MKKREQRRTPEKGMTGDEARALASGIGAGLVDNQDATLPEFVLLLRWLAYVATRDDAETLYIQIEEEFAAYFDGVDEAIQAQMQRALGALRRRASSARKGGAR